MTIDDSYTKALLHFNCADGSTTFTDESGKTWTAYGNAQIDTAQSVFGGASGLFDGNGDYISTPYVADWTFGTGDFTVDFRVRWNALPTSGNFQTLWCMYKWDGTYHNLNGIDLYNNSGTYQIRFVTVEGIGGETINITKNITLSVNTWYHIALVRNGTTFEFFQNGTSIGTGTDDSTLFDTNFTAVYIGYFGGGGGITRYFNGWMDEFRASKGIARWTANFTPPTSEYKYISPSKTVWFF